jgi:hypothetical protein
MENAVENQSRPWRIRRERLRHGRFPTPPLGVFFFHHYQPWYILGFRDFRFQVVYNGAPIMSGGLK